MRSPLSLLGITTGLFISLAALAPSAAYATPSGCSVTPYDAYVEGLCTGGDGEYRAVAVCEMIGVGGTHYLRNEYGPWVGIGVVSTAYCQAIAAGTYDGYLQRR